MKTVVCRVHGQERTRETLQQLQEGGFAPQSVQIQRGLRAAWLSLSCLRTGDSLIIVRTADEHAPRAAAILEAAGAGGVTVRTSPA